MPKQDTHSPPKPGPASRSEQTRHKLILAALDLIGRHGYELATTRNLAAQAEVNLAAIPYHFDTKEALCRSAAEFLAARIEALLHQPLRALQAASANCQDRDRLIDLLSDFLLAQARALLSGEVPQSWLQFFLRSQSEVGNPAAPAFDAVLGPSRRLCQDLVGRILQRPPQDFVTRSLSFSLLHQVLYFRLAEPVLLQHLEQERLSPALLEQLLHLMGTSLRAQLLAHALNTPLNKDIQS